MGLLDSLFKKKEEGILIGSPVEGECISITKVKDPTFAEEILGKGVGIIPNSKRIVAPTDGTVSMIFPTGHAFTMETEDGVELLVHIGIDTVKLEGKHFSKYVSDGDQVKKGDLIIEADFDAIKEEGYDTTIPVVICNTTDFKEVKILKEGAVTATQNVIEIIK